jgi:hypothetical protein
VATAVIGRRPVTVTQKTKNFSHPTDVAGFKSRFVDIQRNHFVA